MRNAILIFFSITAFLFMCGLGIALPSIPRTILNLGYSEVEAGLVISSWAITYVMFSVIAGLLVERIGVTYALPIGLVGNSIIALIYMLTNTLQYFIAGRMLQGIFESLIWVGIYGSVAALFPHLKVRSLGMTSASSISGFSLGLFLNGPLVAAFGLKLTFLLYLFISLLCAVMTYAWLSSSNLRAMFHVQVDNPLKSLKEVNLAAAQVMAMAFFIGCFDGVFQANSDKVAELSGLPSAFGGYFLSAYYISILLSQYALAMLRREISNPHYTMLTFAFASTLFCTVAAAPPRFPLSLLVWAVLGSIVGTNVIIFMSNISSALGSKSVAMGLYQASWGFGYMLAPPLIGLALKTTLFTNIYAALSTFLIANALGSIIRLVKIKKRMGS